MLHLRSQYLHAPHILLTCTYRGTYLLSHLTQPHASQHHHQSRPVSCILCCTSHTLASTLSLSMHQMSMHVIKCCRSVLCNAGSRTKFAATGQLMYHQSTSPPQPATQTSINNLQLRPQASCSSSSGSSSSAMAGAASHDSRSDAATAPCLFAFPLESNFSGARYDPAVVRQVQISGLAVTPCACSKGPEQQCSRQSGLRRTSEEEQQSGQQQAKEEQKSEQQQAQEEQQCSCQQQHAEENPRSDQQQQQQQQQTEEEQQESVQQLQAAAKEEEHQYPGQHTEGEAARLQVRDSGRSEGDRWHVLIDAAKACATAPPDLTQNPADFVVSECPLCSVIFFLLLAGHPISS